MWNVIQCATQGRSHLKTQTPCQDKTFALKSNQGIVAALADGAGSASLSHFGAETITKHICKELSINFDKYFNQNDGVEVKKQLIAGITNCLMTKADELSCQIKDLASTLLVIAIDDDRFIITHIGDGVIGYCKNNELLIASEPENGEFANTTVFTTSKDALMTMKLMKGHLSDINSFILMSDGSEASLYNKKEKTLSEGLKKIITLSEVLSTEKIQDQLQRSFDTYIRNATTDDCSIVMLMDDSNTFLGYRHYSYKKKCVLLGIDPNTPISIVRQYDSILTFAQQERSIRQIAKHLRITQSEAKNRIYRLCELNYIESTNGLYKTMLRL